MPLPLRKPQCVWPARAILGESPCWHSGSHSLFWLDIKGQKLHRYFDSTGQDKTGQDKTGQDKTGQDKTGKTESWPLPLSVGSIALPPPDWPLPPQNADLIFLAGTKNGFAWLVLSDQQVQILPIINPEQHLPGNRFNDGKMGPDGRFYAGSMDDAEQQASGSLYALSSDLKAVKLDTGYKVTNGPAFSPCGHYIYHNDSARQIIYRFTLGADGSLQNRHIFRQFSQGEGYPDGMTTDHAGNLYVAIWDGWRIEVISPDGQTIGTIKCPVARVTSVLFSAADDTVLWATTAAIETSYDAQPLAGGLFRFDITL